MAKFTRGIYKGYTVVNVAGFDIGYLKQLWRKGSFDSEEVREAIRDFVVPKIPLLGSVVQRIDVLKRFDVNLAKTFKFDAKPTFVTSMDIPNFVEQMYKVDASLCGIFIDYFYRYVLQGVRFNDERFLDSVNSVFSKKVKKFLLPLSHHPATMYHMDSTNFKKQKGVKYVRLSKEVPTNVALWLSGLRDHYDTLKSEGPILHDKLVSILQASLSHMFHFGNLNDIRILENVKKIKDIIVATSELDIEKLVGSVLINTLSYKRILCNPIISANGVPADCDLIGIEDNGDATIIEIKVSYKEDREFFPQLMAYAVLARDKYNVKKIAVINYKHRTVKEYDISGWNKRERDRYFGALTANHVPRSDSSES